MKCPPGYNSGFCCYDEDCKRCWEQYEAVQQMEDEDYVDD